MVASFGGPVPAATPEFSQTKDAKTFAPSPIANVAAVLGRDIFYHNLRGVRPPAKHKAVAEVTVTVKYRFEPVE